MPATRTARSATVRSRCTAGWASPGKTTCTCTIAAPRPRRSRLATQRSIASALRGWSSMPRRSGLYFVEQHVRCDGHAHIAPLAVGEVHLSHGNRSAYAQQARPRHQAAFGHGPEVVDLQLDGCKLPRALEMMPQGAAHRGIRQARGDAAVQGSRAV